MKVKDKSQMVQEPCGGILIDIVTSRAPRAHTCRNYFVTYLPASWAVTWMEVIDIRKRVDISRQGHALRPSYIIDA